MGKNDNEFEVEIDLKQIFYTVLDKLPLIILVSIICALAAFLGSKYLITPEYSSKSSVYIVNKANSDSVTTYQDTLSASNLANDFEEMIKTRIVLEEVVNSLGLNSSISDLSSRVSVNTADSARILYVSVRDKDPYDAKRTVDEIVKIAQEKSSDMMDINEIKLWDVGNINTRPVSPNVLKNVILAAAIAFVLALAVVLLRYFMDDTIKRPEDVEKVLDLSVLGVIPFENDTKKKKKKSKRKSS